MKRIRIKLRLDDDDWQTVKNLSLLEYEIRYGAPKFELSLVDADFRQSTWHRGRAYQEAYLKIAQACFKVARRLAEFQHRLAIWRKKDESDAEIIQHLRKRLLKGRLALKKALLTARKIAKNDTSGYLTNTVNWSNSAVWYTSTQGGRWFCGKGTQSPLEDASAAQLLRYLTTLDNRIAKRRRRAEPHTQLLTSHDLNITFFRIKVGLDLITEIAAVSEIWNLWFWEPATYASTPDQDTSLEKFVSDKIRWTERILKGDTFQTGLAAYDEHLNDLFIASRENNKENDRTYTHFRLNNDNVDDDDDNGDFLLSESSSESEADP